ncbi:protein translocase subunit SecDF [Taibaiella chishuiensis]|uniref:Multifunctional fusion protein n=1 Tax=Taibaiella chishuiensis TaxID=1434707 RepID=A0A2P8CYV7_9BACT|nr:protein translocase subunit SecDF [Taibaiella chishuiensis]PSK90117.1 SecD/SecF fusion protein [Taibaiella chishuiensis]
MQLKGMVKFFTAALILFSLWRLSFTFIGHNVEKKVNAQSEKFVNSTAPDAKGVDRELLLDKAYQHITDSLRGETVFNFLGMKYTYQEVKEKELQLGLDLQGGMSVTLEVGLDGLVESMSNNPKDPGLQRAIAEAVRMKANSEADFVKLFGQAYQQVNPNGKLAVLFTKASQPKITLSSSNEQVLSVIRAEAKEAIKRTYNVLSKRIDKFGVSQPSINLDENKGIITVELAGVKNPESVRKYLQATAKLQFWEVATNQEMAQYLIKANTVLKNYLKGGKAEAPKDTAVVAKADTGKTDTGKVAAAAPATTDTGSLSSLLAKDDTSKGAAQSPAAIGDKKEDDLFSIMQPIVDMQSGQFVDAVIVGAVMKKDANKLMEYLKLDVVKNQFPSNIKFLLGEYPGVTADKKNDPRVPYGVYAIKTVNGSDDAKLEGDRVKSAKFDYQQNGKAEIQLVMDQQGTALWARLTKANIGKPIAITLDDFVYSAPTVQNEINGGTSSITGNFTAKDGTDLANILQTGKLEAPAKIVQEQVVGPTLGQESIDGGIESFIVAFLVIFVLMIVYYNTGGIVANIALILNMLFTFGVLSNLGATLTMAGIAGIVLGIGMAVDTNVIIFERIKEELALGDTYEEAVSKGYRRSYAPILDGHITSLITAVVLLVFGLGPIKGFATTQIIALLLSLFTGILVSRLITDIYMRRGRHFKYFTGLSKSIFQKAKFHFIEKRKISYVISSILIIAGFASLIHGFDYGVEFDGGRSYTIKFDQPQKETEVREKLNAHLGKYPVVKKIGVSDQLNITTDYMIEKSGPQVESEVLGKLYDGLKAEHFIPANVDLNTFATKYVQSTQTVLPTISDDLKKGAVTATAVAVLAIFIYIFVRFRKWQYSMGTIVALVHDVAITLAVFSFFKDIVPFALEIDQHFIAAVLTVIGFSMNDTVIVFDRVREYFRKDPNGNKKEIVNHAINDTLSRTIMTSLTVFLTAVILFIFGGEALRGFAFAMAIGVLAGTYSSIFVAAPVLVDLDKSDSLRIEEDKEERIKQLKEQA